jgi:hypothetical protein
MGKMGYSRSVKKGVLFSSGSVYGRAKNALLQYKKPCPDGKNLCL